MQARTALETLIPLPRRREVDHVDLAAPGPQVWDALRRGDVVWPFVMRALIRARTKTAGSERRQVETGLGFGNLRSTAEQPGFHLMGDEPGRQFTLGALADMRVVTFEFLPIASSEAFGQLSEPGFVKVAWCVDIAPLDAASSRLRFELRLDATDDLSWRRFRRTYVLLGPLVRLLRRHVLAALADQFGVPELRRQDRNSRNRCARAHRSATVSFGIPRLRRSREAAEASLRAHRAPRAVRRRS